MTCCLHLGKSNRTFLLKSCFLPLPMAHMGLLWKSAGQQEKEAAQHRLERERGWHLFPMGLLSCHRKPTAGGGRCTGKCYRGVCDLPPTRASLLFIPCPPPLELEIVGVRVEGKKRNQIFNMSLQYYPLEISGKCLHGNEECFKELFKIFGG